MNWLGKGKQVMRSLGWSVEGKLRVPVAIGLGAIAGALSRYFLAMGINRWLGTSFPFATFFINISGALIMGFFAALAIRRSITVPEVRLIVAVGFLGSYTTFSTYTLEIESLLQTGNWQFTTLYWLGSTLLGLLALEFGGYLARKLL